MNELAHHGADDELRWFSIRLKPLAEGFAPSRFINGNHRWHVQRSSQESMPHFGQSGLGSDAGAGFVMSWIEPGKSGELTRAIEALSA